MKVSQKDFLCGLVLLVIFSPTATRILQRAALIYKMKLDIVSSPFPFCSIYHYYDMWYFHNATVPQQFPNTKTNVEKGELYDVSMVTVETQSHVQWLL